MVHPASCIGDKSSPSSNIHGGHSWLLPSTRHKIVKSLKPATYDQLALGAGTLGIMARFESLFLLNLILERKDLEADLSPIAGSGTLWLTITLFWSCSPRISAAAEVIGSLIIVLEKSMEWGRERGRGLPRLSGGGGVGVYLVPASSLPLGLLLTFIWINLALCILDMRYANWSLLLSRSDLSEVIRTSFFWRLSVRSALVDFSWNWRSFILACLSSPLLSSTLFCWCSSAIAHLYFAFILFISSGGGWILNS